MIEKYSNPASQLTSDKSQGQFAEKPVEKTVEKLAEKLAEEFARISHIFFGDKARNSMLKISKESIENFQSVLETVDNSGQTEFNLRETVRKCFYLIKNAKEKKKVSWERIAEALRNSCDITDRISPASIRQYYFEFAKHPELLDKKKRKTNSTKNRARGSTPVGFSAKIEKCDSEVFGTNQPDSFGSDPEPKPAISPLESNLESTLEHPSEQQVAQPEQAYPTRDKVRAEFNLNRRGR